MKKIRFSAFLLLSVLIVLFVSGGILTAPKEILIGVVSSMSGANAPQGQDVANGNLLAEEIVNGNYDIDIPFAKGEGLPGLGGAKIKIIVADSQGSAEVGMAEAERLITMKNVIAIVGTNQSAVTKTVSQVAERYGIPCVNNTSSAVTLTQRGFQWFFSATPNDNMFIDSSFDWLADLKQKKNISMATLALINENTEFGAQIAEVERTNAAARGYKIVADITYTPGTADLKGEAMRLKNANPDIIMATGYSSDAILLVKTLKEVDFAPKVFLGHRGGYTLTEFIKSLGKDANYICTTGVWATDIPIQNKVAGQVDALFKKLYGQPLTSESSRSFTSMMALLDAINRAGSTNPDAIREALLKTNIPASDLIIPWGGIKYDAKTHLNPLGKAIVAQIIDGEFRAVWPFDISAKELIYPVPAWSSSLRK